MALLLDLSNILGGFLLAVGLLARSPRIGDGLAHAAARLAPFGWLVGVVALVAGGYYLIVHLTSGPHVFHFEVVGIGVGVALLWDRLTGRTGPATRPHGGPRVWARPGTGPVTATRMDTATGTALLLAIFGIIAMIVGVQGLFTPN